MIMKKIICAILMVAILLLTLTGCNYQVVDTTYSFDTAIIALPNGDIVKGGIQSWKDYTDSDMVQIKIDGTTYYTHASNVILINE